MNPEHKAEDPNTIKGQHAACWGASELAGQVPIVGKLGSAAVNLVCGQSERKKEYQEVLPLLRHQIAQENPHMPTVLRFAAKLTSTASFGARRHNFRRHYIDGKTSGDITSVDADRVAKLPPNPDDIMYGFW